MVKWWGYLSQTWGSSHHIYVSVLSYFNADINIFLMSKLDSPIVIEFANVIYYRWRISHHMCFCMLMTTLLCCCSTTVAHHEHTGRIIHYQHVCTTRHLPHTHSTDFGCILDHDVFRATPSRPNPVPHQRLSMTTLSISPNTVGFWFCEEIKW